MRRKRLAAGEVRFRVSKDDLQRIERLMIAHEHQSVSALLRTLIRNADKEIANGKKQR